MKGKPGCGRRPKRWPLLITILSFLYAATASAEVTATFTQDTRLGEWLADVVNRSHAAGNADVLYPLGLSWTVPQQIAPQTAAKQQLLARLREERATGLIDFIASLPVTGRVRVPRSDARWLEANPRFDPVMRAGDRVIVPNRPRTVTVVKPDGTPCQVVHQPEHAAAYYLQRCGNWQSAAQAWIIQPDGVVQRRGVAAWNADTQDPPAPGAWVLALQPGMAWSEATLDAVAQFLATQGPALDREDNGIAVPIVDDATSYRTPRSLPATASDWGTVGLLQTPSARMADAGEVSLTVSRSAPYRYYTVVLQPSDWFEGGFRYVDVSNRLYGVTDSGQSRKDKSFDLKLRALRESAYVPQVAVGLRDLAGTGAFSGEYIVASKRHRDWDWSLGLGWGYLGSRGDTTNPFSYLDERFSRRPSRAGYAKTGGQANLTSWFRGETAWFGGVQYHTPWESWVVKAEYDGNNYQHEPLKNPQRQDSPFNFGVVYRATPAIDFSLAFERGNTVSFGVSLHGQLDRITMPKLHDPARIPVKTTAPASPPNWLAVSRTLETQTGWHLDYIQRQNDEIITTFDDADATYRGTQLDRIAATLHREAPEEVTGFRVSTLDFGLHTSDFVIDRATWVDQQTRYVPEFERQAAIVEREPIRDASAVPAEPLVDHARRTVRTQLGLGYTQTLGGPDEFLLYQLAAVGSARWQPTTGMWLTGTLRARLIDNYDNFTYTGPSLLPRVRTYQREYLTTSDVTLPVLQLTHVGRIGREHFYSMYGGILEPMFGGVGAEWLYRPWGSPVAFGVDLNRVRQRAFEQDFDFRDYRATTGHGSVYWDAVLTNLDVALHAGRYLAGDTGVTLDVSRVFRNGVRMGAFATKTNLSADEFGEGSFDKGVYIDIPFDAFLTRSSGSTAQVLWRPLTRDGGAMLSRSVRLIDVTQGQAGNGLRFGPADELPP